MRREEEAAAAAGRDERGREGRSGRRGGRHYAKQGLGRPSRQAEMRCQHCTGALMYECGENQTRHSTDRRGLER